MMNNPFKLDSIVDGEFFTDRHVELIQIERMLNSDNHIILISPRRFGKPTLLPDFSSSCSSYLKKCCKTCFWVWKGSNKYRYLQPNLSPLDEKG